MPTTNKFWAIDKPTKWCYNQLCLFESKLFYISTFTVIWIPQGTLSGLRGEARWESGTVPQLWFSPDARSVGLISQVTRLVVSWMPSRRGCRQKYSGISGEPLVFWWRQGILFLGGGNGRNRGENGLCHSWNTTKQYPCADKWRLLSGKREAGD